MYYAAVIDCAYGLYRRSALITAFRFGGKNFDSIRLDSRWRIDFSIRFDSTIW